MGDYLKYQYEERELAIELAKKHGLLKPKKKKTKKTKRGNK